MQILVAEDDQFFRNFYTTKLQESGHQVVATADGEEALQKLESATPDLILLDIIMPKKSGFDVLTAMQQNPKWSTIPVIVFSTLGQESDVQKAMQLGAKDYINKSYFDYDKMLAKIVSYEKK